LGSEYYTAHPAYALARTAAVINIEGLTTLGPARDIGLVSGGQNDLEQMLEQSAQEQGRTLVDEIHPERGGFYRSDQFSFARLGVPVLVTTPGLDLYGGGEVRGRALMEVFLTQRDHKPGDEFFPNWDLTGAFRDLQLLRAVGVRVADSSDWPEWRAGDPYRAVRDTSRRSR
jgi:Zn-dependent M28 family amino/carboxypeptidase